MFVDVFPLEFLPIQVAQTMVKETVSIAVINSLTFPVTDVGEASKPPGLTVRHHCENRKPHYLSEICTRPRLIEKMF